MTSTLVQIEREQGGIYDGIYIRKISGKFQEKFTHF